MTPQSAQPLSGTRVLVVEDEALIAEEIRDRLSSRGMTVVGVADNAADAVVLAGGEQPDLALMDIRLKGKADGVDAAVRIYREFGVPAVFLTAHSDEATLKRALRAGQFGYVLKPFQELELLVAIRMALGRHRIDLALRESQSTFRSIVAGLLEAVVATDAAHRIRYMNPAAEALTGWTLADASERPVDEVLRLRSESSDTPISTASVCAAMGDDARSQVLSARLATADEQGRAVELAVSRVENAGRPVGASIAIYDPADRRELEARRRQAEEEVRSLNRDLEARIAERTAALRQANSELEAFIYSVSHDLRAPLRTVGGMSRMLREAIETQPAPRAGELLDGIDENMRHMSMRIEALLEFSRLGSQPLNRALIDLQALANEVVAEAGPEIDRCEVVVGEMPAVFADPVLVRIVLSNLLSNAVKFSSARRHPRIEIGCERVDGEEVLYVRDNGVGLPMRYAEKAFEVFERLHADARFPGVGAGLAIVKRIVERHGGRISIDAKVGKGATFRFTLPSPETLRRP